LIFTAQSSSIIPPKIEHPDSWRFDRTKAIVESMPGTNVAITTVSVFIDGLSSLGAANPLLV
jgi:hypothetical protein